MSKTEERPTATPPESATQRAYGMLRDKIIAGDIAPGDRLKVDTLKTLLEIGASPIREALSLLTSDQLVERIDQRGFRAAPASRSHFDEILGLRCTLEEIALCASIKSGDSGWEEGLVLAHHRLRRVDKIDTPVFEARHKAFHMALLEACGSPILFRFCGQLYDLNIRYRYLAGKAVNYQRRDVAAEHDQILHATIERDAGLASNLLTAHYRKTGEFLAAQFAGTK